METSQIKITVPAEFHKTYEAKLDKKDAHKKMFVHILLILTGCVIAVGLSYIPKLGWFSIPVGQTPYFAQEIVDMIHRW